MNAKANVLFASVLTFFICILSISTPLSAQYTMHGHTVSAGGNCYELTTDSIAEGGSIWYSKLFNLNQPLDVQFSLFLGCKPYSIGADGMAFVFQPLSTNAGFTGGGLGYGGIKPSLDVEFDTYQNNPWDPAYAHIAIEQNGNFDHTVAADLLAGPVQMSPLLPNLPDCKPHQARIIWDPKSKTLKVYFDCSLRCSYTGDIVNNIFSGNPNVYWGFTASTGGASNIQGLCIEHTFLQNLRDTLICKGTSLPLLASGGKTYSWTPAAGLSSTTIANPVATPAATTKYYVTATDSCGIAAVDSITVTVDDIVLTPTSSNVKCYGGNSGSASVAVTGAMGVTSCNWLPAGGTNTTAAALMAASYTVTVTDTNHCKTSLTIPITQPPSPLGLAATGLSTSCNGSCEGQTVVIPSGGTAPYSATWSTMGTGLSLSGLCTGTYSLSISDANGCTKDSSVFVPQTSALVLTPSSVNALCNLGNGSVSITTAGGTPGAGGYTCQWSNGFTGGKGSGSPFQVTGIGAGTYTLTVTDQNNCSSTATATITQPNPLLIAAIPTAHACIGQNTILAANPSGGTPAYTLTWNPGALSGTGITVDPAISTSYSVTASDANGCISNQQTVSVKVNAPLLAMIPPVNSVCPGTSVTLQAQSSGGDSLYNYTWLTNPVQHTANITFVADSQATYSLVLSDGCGTPPDTASFTLITNPVPVVKFSADILSGCPDLCVNFSDNSKVASGNIVQWNWNFGDSLSVLQNPPSCFNLPGQYSVSLMVKSDKGCISSDTLVNMITVYPTPKAAFSYSPVQATVIDPVQFTNLSEGAISWIWNLADPADSGNTGLQNPVHNYATPGTYCISLAVANVHNCIDTIRQCIEVIPEFTFYVPTAFSPNGDGHNDVFNGSGYGIKNYKLSVFDRWGALIFSSSDTNQGWDGTAVGGGNISQQGIYVYEFQITDVFEKFHAYTGQVALVK